MRRKAVWGSILGALLMGVLAVCAYFSVVLNMRSSMTVANNMIPEQESPAYYVPPPEDVDEMYASEGGGADYSAIERLIIRDASLDLVVTNTEDAFAEINDLVDELGGWIVESGIHQYQGATRAYIKFRVPAESLDTALERVRDIATEVQSESVSGQDVTEEYVDLQSRLSHLEATEARLIEFMENAQDAETALAVFEQLQEIQEQTELVKGRIQYLQESAAMATVTLHITPDELAQPIEVGGWNLGGASREAIENLVDALQFLVEDVLIPLVLTVIPILIVVAAPFVGLFFLVRGIVHRRRVHKAKQT